MVATKPNNILSSHILDAKRDLMYSITSLGSIATLWGLQGPNYTASTLNSDHSTFGLQFVTFIIVLELFKVVIALGLYPASSNSFYSLSNVSGKELLASLEVRAFQLPVRLEGSHSVMKVVESLGAVVSFLLFFGICHIVIVLFGAPITENIRGTGMFTGVLAAWTYIPFYLIIRPNDVCIHLYFIGAWTPSTLSPTFLRHKWRFILTILGAWAGAVVIPLDWDRSWQRWPIPCLYSLCLSHFLIHVFYSIQLSFFLAAAAGQRSSVGGLGGRKVW